MAKKKLWKWNELSANQKAEIKKEFPRWSDKFLKTLQFYKEKGKWGGRSQDFLKDIFFIYK